MRVDDLIVWFRK